MSSMACVELDSQRKATSCSASITNDLISHDFERWWVSAQVTFYLHPSFNNPARDMTESPFEVSEMGWGEFEINIKVLLVLCCRQQTVIAVNRAVPLLAASGLHGPIKSTWPGAPLRFCIAMRLLSC